MPQSQKNNISKALTGKAKSKEHNDKVSEAMKGKTWTEERKLAKSTQLKENPVKYWEGKSLYDSTKEKISKALSGRKQKLETVHRRAKANTLFSGEQQLKIYKEHKEILKKLNFSHGSIKKSCEKLSEKYSCSIPTIRKIIKINKLKN